MNSENTDIPTSIQFAGSVFTEKLWTSATLWIPLPNGYIFFYVSELSCEITDSCVILCCILFRLCYEYDTTKPFIRIVLSCHRLMYNIVL